MKEQLFILGKRQRSSRANARGGKQLDKGDSGGAIEHYRKAIALDPSWDAPHFNLGVLYKYAGKWEASLEANLRATELAPDASAAWWNLGIAATALGRWDLARKAWRGAGVPVPDGEGPLDWPCGSHPIRLNPGREGETVWSERLDPARARLTNIPLADYCYGDVVLHDGAAAGYRELDGRQVPVFDCLALLEPSPLSTWCVEIELDRAMLSDDTDAAFRELGSLADARGLAAEDWTARPAPPGPHRIAIAAHTRGEVNDLLDDWRPGRFGAGLGGVHIAFSHA
jgi:hypothetical protein